MYTHSRRANINEQSTEIERKKERENCYAWRLHIANHSTLPKRTPHALTRECTCLLLFVFGCAIHLFLTRSSRFLFVLFSFVLITDC